MISRAVEQEPHFEQFLDLNPTVETDGKCTLDVHDTKGNHLDQHEFTTPVEAEAFIRGWEAAGATAGPWRQRLTIVRQLLEQADDDGIIESAQGNGWRQYLLRLLLTVADVERPSVVDLTIAPQYLAERIRTWLENNFHPNHPVWQFVKQ